jgi:hypothetical protein
MDEELLDIAEFASPGTWQKAMVMHGFDPVEHTCAEFVEFCERLEFTETPYSTNTEAKPQAISKSGNNGTIWSAKSTARGNSYNNKFQKNRNFRQNTTAYYNNNFSSNPKRKYYAVPPHERWCEYHNKFGHDTGDCEVMKAQARSMRACAENARERGANNGVNRPNPNPRFQNKSWTRPEFEEKPQKKEVNFQANAWPPKWIRPMKAALLNFQEHNKNHGKGHYAIEGESAEKETERFSEEDIEACMALCNEFDNEFSIHDCDDMAE